MKLTFFKRIVLALLFGMASVDLSILNAMEAAAVGFIAAVQMALSTEIAQAAVPLVLKLVQTVILQKDQRELDLIKYGTSLIPLPQIEKKSNDHSRIIVPRIADLERLMVSRDLEHLLTQALGLSITIIKDKAQIDFKGAVAQKIFDIGVQCAKEQIDPLSFKAQGSIDTTNPARYISFDFTHPRNFHFNIALDFSTTQDIFKAFGDFSSLPVVQKITVVANVIVAGIRLSYAAALPIIRSFNLVSAQNATDTDYDQIIQKDSQSYAIYKAAVSDVLKLFYALRSKDSSQWQAALVELNNLSIKGTIGRKLDLLVKQLNDLYFTKDGILKSGSRSDETIRKTNSAIAYFTSAVVKQKDFNAFLDNCS